METNQKKINDENNFDETVVKSKGVKRRNMIVAVVAALVVVVLGVFFCYTKIFVLSEIKVQYEGSGIPYTDEQIVSAAQLKKGTPLHEINTETVRENTKYSLPYVNIDVEKKWPSTVVIKAQKKNGCFYMTVSGKLYILSEDLVVLEKTDKIQKIENETLIFLELSGINECVEGQKVNVDKSIEEILSELVKLLKKHKLFDKITEIDLSNKFDIRMNYGAKYHIIMGDIKKAEQKIQVLKLTIDDKLTVDESGMIDVSNEKVGVFKPY